MPKNSNTSEILKIYCSKLTPRPTDKDGFKKAFKKDWQNSLIEVPFDKAHLSKAGYIGLPRKSKLLIMDIDDDLLFNIILYDIYKLKREQIESILNAKKTLLAPNNGKYPIIVKSNKGGHLYYRLPSNTDLKQYNTDIDFNKPFLSGIVDLPNGAYMPYSDINKFILLKPKNLKFADELPTIPPLFIEYILNYLKDVKVTKDNKDEHIAYLIDTLTSLLNGDKNSNNKANSKNSTIQSDGVERKPTKSRKSDKDRPTDFLEAFNSLSFNYGKIIKAYLSPTNPAGASINIAYIAALYKSPIHKRDLEQLYINFKITSTILADGESHKALRDFVLKTATDQTVDEESWVDICYAYNEYLDRSETDKEEIKSIIRSTKEKGYFIYNPNSSLTTEYFDPTLNTVRSVYLTEKGYLIASMTNQSYQIVNRTLAERNVMLYGGLPKSQAKKVLDFALPVTLVQDPTKDFGYHKDEQNHLFNITPPAPEYDFFRRPLAKEILELDENKNIINAYLAAIKNLCNEEDLLVDYLLSYFHYRYKHPKLRPIVFILWGMGGTGKDWLISLLSRPFSGQNVETLTEFQVADKHATWMAKPDVHIAEVGDWSKSSRNQLISLVKTVSGSNGKVTIRPMGETTKIVNTICQIYFSTNHPVRLFSTANELRRYVVLHSRSRTLEQVVGKFDTTPEELMDLDKLQLFFSWLAHYKPKFKLTDFNNAFKAQKSKSFELYQNAVFTVTDRVTVILNTMGEEYQATQYVSFDALKKIAQVADINIKDMLQEWIDTDDLKFKENELKLEISKSGLSQHFLDLNPFRQFLSTNRKYFGSKKEPYIIVRLLKEEVEEYKKLVQREIKQINDGEEIEL